MELGYNLKLEQKQKLIITPELRQAIQILQFNSISLNEFLVKELEENPMLEMENSSKDAELIEIDQKDSNIDIEDYYEKYDDISYKAEVDKNIKDYNIESYTTYSPSLRESLLQQLSLLEICKDQYKIGEYLIESIDDNGYLTASIEEVSKIAKAREEDIRGVLACIQAMEPAGIGARDLKECLMLQIEEKAPPLVRKLIENHLEDIAYNRINKMAKENDIDINMIQKLSDYIRSLDPKPGRVLGEDSDYAKYIVPDATIKLVEGQYIIEINDYTAPRLNINKFYDKLLRNSVDMKTKDFLQKRFNSAIWLIKSIEQRKQTIYKVVESVLKFQMGFFKNGEKALVPLNLKEVAEDIDMHESTVSRATNGKYVQTPRGLLELKYFFSAGLSGSHSEVSSTSVKAMIKELINQEDSKKPLSDQKISKILEEKGTKVSRRTIAKYRDELNIPASNLRKRY